MSSVADKLLLNVAPWLAAKIMGWQHRRLKPETIGVKAVSQLWAEEQPVILAFWHDQLFLMIKGYEGQGAKVLISASKDGELIARTMAYFDVGSVRGSSNRGGRAAFREMVELSREQLDLAFTPDGPKGPRHVVKEGVVQLARISKRPIVPIAFACSNGHRFRSWDHFLFPYPWGKAVYSYGEPLYYDKNETIDNFQSRVQEAMADNTRRAGEHLKQYGLSAV